MALVNIPKITTTKKRSCRILTMLNGCVESVVYVDGRKAQHEGNAHRTNDVKMKVCARCTKTDINTLA